MHDLAFVLRAELGGQPARGAAHQGREFLGVVADDSSCHQLALFVGQVDRVTGFEGALDTSDAGREEAGAPS